MLQNVIVQFGLGEKLIVAFGTFETLDFIMIPSYMHRQSGSSEEYFPAARTDVLFDGHPVLFGPVLVPHPIIGKSLWTELTSVRVFAFVRLTDVLVQRAVGGVGLLALLARVSSDGVLSYVLYQTVFVEISASAYIAQITREVARIVIQQKAVRVEFFFTNGTNQKGGV